MTADGQPKNRRVLIASNHGLFAQGLRSLLMERQAAGVEVVGVVSNMEQAMSALEKLNPDLIVVDYDDESLNRDEFLARFVEGEQKLRVVLLSLQGGSEAIVYDRRTLAASEVDDWLDEWTYSADANALPFESQGRGEPLQNRSENMKNRAKGALHFVVASILVAISTVVVGYLLWWLWQNNLLLPKAASAQAVPIDELFVGQFAVIAFLFSLIVVFMLYSIFVFRRKKGDLADGPHVEGNTKLEITWTVIPLIVVMGFAVWGGQALKDTLAADPRPVIIRVIGQQWSWRFEYPQPDGSAIVTDRLMMPVNQQAELRLASTDVIHSFWVPEFRVKQDALPGGDDYVRKLLVTPTEIGEYTLRCAELCGEKHATMESAVLVVSQADFDSWVIKESGLSDDPVVRGQKWAQTFGCAACHSIDGSKVVGPTWKGLYGSERRFADGSTATADDAYLLSSIVDPNLQVVEGFQPGIMVQTFGQQMTEQQIADVIAYIKSLK